MKTTKVFLDTEFTGLNQNAQLISIGLISECGKTFYSEFSDFDLKKANENSWLMENVIKNMIHLDKIDLSKGEFVYKNFIIEEFSGIGITWMVKIWLNQFFELFEKVEIWSDCLAYDWVLFCEIFGGAFFIPQNVSYIPFDICTLFKIKGIDPDISREKFALGEHYSEMPKHNALWDAEIIKKCYEKLTQ